MIKLPKIADKVKKDYLSKISIDYSSFAPLILMKSYSKITNKKVLFDSILVDDVFSPTYPNIDIYNFVNEYIEITKIVHIHKSTTVKSIFKMYGLTGNDYAKDYIALEKKFNSFLNSNIVKPFNSHKKLNEQIENLKKEYEKMNEEFKKKIVYETLNEDNKSLKKEILNGMNIQVCPYCNRNFITIVKRGNKIINTAAIDHFYPKHFYPLFALSLYNFVPSCFACNSLFKKERIGFLRPYEKGFDSDAKFKLEIKDDEKVDFYFGIKDVDFEIKIDVDKNSPYYDKIKYNIKNLKLEELYSSEDYFNYSFVKNMIKRDRLSKDASVKNILKNIVFNNELSEDKIDELIYGYKFDDKEPMQKPFAKLAKDILNK